MSNDLKQQLLDHAKSAVSASSQAQNEAATRMFLVLPFLRLLGYDTNDPKEIVPEVDAAFADKFKNKVDFAILKDGEPVIAIETKKVGSLSDANKGEIKGYFNAIYSVKLGILTDGITYQLFSDSARANMMDDFPFAVIDLEEVSQGHVSDTVFDAILKLRKDNFDPEKVGSDAERNLHINAYLDTLEEAFKDPQKDLVRSLMNLVKVEGNRTQKRVEDHTAFIQDAMRMFLDKKILERVGYADRDLIKMSDNENKMDISSFINAEEQNEGQQTGVVDASGIQTTETELQVFDYVRRRLSFLIDRDEALYEKLEHISMKDRKQVLNVSYKLEQKGKLFGFREGNSPKYRFEFSGSNTKIETDHLSEIDDELLAIFSRRVEELG